MKTMSLFLLIVLFIKTPHYTQAESTLNFLNDTSIGYWHSSVIQNNESRPIVMQYDELYTFYQDEFLQFTLSNINYPYTKIQFTVTNGSVGILRDRDYNNCLDWEIELHVTDFQNQYYCLTPEDLHINFDMKFMIKVLNGTEQIYSEEHTFWIVGEPEVIPGEDPNEDIDIRNIYLSTLITSGIVFGLVSGIILVRKKYRGEK